MTTKLSTNEQQILIDYLNYWAKDYQLDIHDKLDCDTILSLLIDKSSKEEVMKNPRLFTNMIVVKYLWNKVINSEEED